MRSVAQWHRWELGTINDFQPSEHGWVEPAARLYLNISPADLGFGTPERPTVCVVDPPGHAGDVFRTGSGGSPL
ncbi:MAG: hypothetical protein CL424_03625, partial [Acidimicrobiaceae bacterium]|nr:hypothetical protein [Acidimicrobiaceae bacterium]